MPAFPKPLGIEGRMRLTLAPLYPTLKAGDMPTRDEMAKKRFCTFTLKKLAGIGSKKGRSSSHSALRLFPTKQGKVPLSIQRYAHQMKVVHGLKKPCLTIFFS